MFRKCLMLSLLVSLPYASQAQTVFMVQLGAYDTEAEARQHWNTLTETFPDTFESLEYSPNEVVMKPDNFVTYRTQAGPIATRQGAESICSELLSSNFECYVAETAMFYGDSDEVVTAGLTQAQPAPQAAPQPAPVLTQQPVPAPAPPVAPVPAAPQQPQPQQLTPPPAPAPVAYVPPAAPAPAPAPQPITQPVLNTASSSLPQGYVPSVSATASNPSVAPQPLATTRSTTQTAITPTIPSAAAGQGAMVVEEAIPVPLSRAANPYLERGNQLMNAHPSDSSRISSYWADIGYFGSERAAVQYVQLLKQRDSLLPPKLRIRVTRPYKNIRGEQKFALRLGPFVTTRPVRRVCALTRAENLRCRAIKDLGGSVRNPSRYSNRYKQTRRRVASGNARRSGNVNASAPRGSRAVTQNYYVQLGSFLSPAAAETKWNELNARHGGMLSQAAKDISSPRSSTSRSRLYRLRTGPYSDYASASSMCNRLKQRGTLCIIVKQ